MYIGTSEMAKTSESGRKTNARIWNSKTEPGRLRPFFEIFSRVSKLCQRRFKVNDAIEGGISEALKKKLFSF